MFFRKKIERRCSYCLRSAALDEDTVLCVKKGIRSAAGKCWRFRYDPCKRIPARPKALDFTKYDREDFSL
jgi:hypothetical protein